MLLRLPEKPVGNDEAGYLIFEAEGKMMRYLGIWLLLLMGAELASIVMMADWLGGLPVLLLMIVSFAGIAYVAQSGVFFGHAGRIAVS